MYRGKTIFSELVVCLLPEVFKMKCGGKCGNPSTGVDNFGQLSKIYIG
jgi:hypothetical protein